MQQTIYNGRALRWLAGASVAIVFSTSSTNALAQEAQGGQKGKPGDRRPIVIEKQGSFYYGYDTITAPGTYGPASFFGNQGDFFTLNQGYVFFQIPPNARQYPLVMVHGGGQTGKTYEDFEDRENY